MRGKRGGEEMKQAGAKGVMINFNFKRLIPPRRGSQSGSAAVGRGGDVRGDLCKKKNRLNTFRAPNPARGALDLNLFLLAMRLSCESKTRGGNPAA